MVSTLRTHPCKGTVGFLFCAGLLLGVAGAGTQANPPQAPNGSAITLTSPLNYQVFQRRTRLRGDIVVLGEAHVRADGAEARVTGTSLLSRPLDGRWKRLSLDRTSGKFHGKLPVTAGGFYQLEVRLREHNLEVAETRVLHLGLGEVFVISGQSNATNYGEVRQQTQTGMVTSFNGTSWAIANDPQQGAQDNSNQGSFIPSFGDALYRKYRVPIGVAVVGHGSTSVRQWLPKGEPVIVMPTMTRYVTRDTSGALVSDGTLFEGMMVRIDLLGKHGFRALLWHQGESDANQPAGHQISAEQYQAMLEHIIRMSRKDAGWNFPWFVAEVSYHSPQDPSCPPIREAQRGLWRKGIALQGPDTDTLTGSYRQNNGRGVHFNDAGLKAHGMLWAEKVEAFLGKKLN